MRIIDNWLDDIPGPHRGQDVILTGASLDAAAAAMILIPGGGATADNILDLANLFAAEGVAYLAPQAARNTWYPFSFLEPRESNEPGLSSAHAAIAAIIAKLAERGIERERIILLGFSQGACLATDHAARNPTRYAGVVGLSGGLIGDRIDPEAYTGSLDGTPVYLGCSDIDPHIPEARVHQTAAVMEQLGAQVTTDIFPGMGHTIVREEVDRIQAILNAL